MVQDEEIIAYFLDTRTVYLHTRIPGISARDCSSSSSSSSSSSFSSILLLFLLITTPTTISKVMIISRRKGQEKGTSHCLHFNSPPSSPATNEFSGIHIWEMFVSHDGWCVKGGGGGGGRRRRLFHKHKTPPPPPPHSAVITAWCLDKHLLCVHTYCVMHTAPRPLQ